MRLLFVTSNRIGDAVLSTGVLARLLEQNPGARVTVACGPAPASLFTAVPGLERLILMPKRKRGGHWLDLWRRTVLRPWDLVVDLRASAIAYLLPTHRRMIFRPRHEPVHRVVQLGRLFANQPPPAPRLWLTREHEERAAELVPAGGSVLGIGPTANWGGKIWPAERFVAAIERLTTAGGILPQARVAVFGGPDERAAAASVLAALPPERRLDLVGAADLPTTAAALQRCALYLGNDSGVMHLAAAAGAPVLGLFGPSKETLYAPWGEHTAWVRTDKSFEEIVGAPGYDHRVGDTRMESLSVDKVVAAAEVLWRRVAAADRVRA